MVSDRGTLVKFQEAVFALQMIHHELWFYAEGDFRDLTHSDKWRLGEIRSTGGTLLAMQTGHPDEWELTPFYNRPDTGQIIDKPDPESAVTEEFLRRVRLMMVTQVYPNIDDNGVFTPPEEDPDWKW